MGLLFSTRIGEGVFVAWGVVISSPFCRYIFFYPCHGWGRGGRCRACLRLLYAGIIFNTRVVVGRAGVV